MVKFQTISVIAGTAACQARCDFCISKLTPAQGVEEKGASNIDFSNLAIACRLAEKSGVTTALITGKGEPTLFPDDVSEYLRYLRRYFPIIELQTNAINFTRNRLRYERYLIDWKKMGLTTIIISVVHYDDLRNREVYCDTTVPALGGEQDRFDYPPLADTVEYLHSLGFSVRLGCVGCKGYIDSQEELQKMIDFCKTNEVEQLTWRPVTKPEDNIQDKAVHEATNELSIDYDDVKAIRTWVGMNGMRLLTLAHGAEVYDVKGQNLCLSSCLTHDASTEDQRQLIYFPHGHIRYSWVYPGAIVL
jgi:pyruvate-formate lyase-activating enzyme